MDFDLTCESIFQSIFPVAKSVAAPIAYIEIAFSPELSCCKNKIHDYFKKISWDTELSSSDICVKEDPTLEKSTIKIVRLVEFADDEGNEGVHEINKIIKV